MNRTKSFLKIWVFALSMLFVIALTLGITMAAYNTSRTADGTLSMGNGIIIDYSGFGKAQDGEWQKEQTTTFKLFANRDILPGDTINLNSAAIKKGTNSIDFYARIKFEYKFYDALDADITTTVGNEYTNFISTPAFNSAWVDGNAGDSWFYYATGTTLNTLPASYVNIFSSSAINVELNVAGFNHEGGGYKFTDAGSNEVTIAKVEAILTLETVQTTGSTWEIIPLVQNSSSQVIEIQSNEITLGNVGGAYKLGTGEAGTLSYDTTSLGTTLKIVVAGDSQINANAFENSTLENVYIGDAEYIDDISTYAAKIYSGEKPTFIIGANAFRGCTNLNVYLSSSCNYQIYASSLSGVGNIYVDGVLDNGLKNPSVGQYNGYINVVATPSIVTGGTGAGAVNQVSDSKGEYTYEDASGNIWYFNLGSLNEYGINGSHRFLNNGGAEYASISYCSMSDSITNNQTIIIPSNLSTSELNYIPVVRIAGGYSDGYLVTNVLIPNTIKIIGSYAFHGNTNIETGNVAVTNLNIPSSVECIESNVFRCRNLTTINLPNSLLYIAPGTFECRSLVSFTASGRYNAMDEGKLLVDGTSIVAVAKGGITEGSYTIPEGITEISNSVFSGVGFTEVVIPSSVLAIRYGAFSSCYTLERVILSEGLEIIEQNAFLGCGHISEIIIPSSVTYIGVRAFENYSTWGFPGLETISFTGGRTSNIEILQGAFEDNINLTSVVFYGDWTGIAVTLGDDVFKGCTSLTNLQIPNQE